MTSTTRASVVVLAGRRSDAVDPFSASHGVPDKFLIPIEGRALIDHVLAALIASPDVCQIIVSLNEPAMLERAPLAADLLRQGRVRAVASRNNLAESLYDAAGQAGFPLLVTTADNVLLTPQAVSRMVRKSLAEQADIAVAFARKQDVLAAHAEGQRRFYRFRDGEYSNCNCYWIASQAVLHAAEAFREGGQFSKNPRRIARAFGLANLIRFRLGWCSLSDGLDAVGRRLGFSMVPIIADDGALAIDVDNERTYGVAQQILGSRIQRREAA